jgi:hypothetical protein
MRRETGPAIAVVLVLVIAPAARAATRAETAREEARRILQQDRYQPEDVPRPFRGPLEWIADRMEPVGDGLNALFGWFADLFGAVANGIPGGAATLWLIIGLGVVLLVATQTRRMVERRGRSKATERSAGAAARGDDPRELERRAADAAARGDHALEVRLLFQAGVLRLARARVIPARRSLTTGEIRRLLRSGDFDAVGGSFDAIAYGGRPASRKDGDAARSGWSRVLEEVDK